MTLLFLFLVIWKLFHCHSATVVDTTTVDGGQCNNDLIDRKAAKEKFNIAFQKLLDIDKINYELWSILAPKKVKDSNQFEFDRFFRVTFRQNEMNFYFTTEWIAFDLKGAFGDISAYNLFNDPLPVTEYKEMKGIFLKYSFLDPLNGDVFKYLQVWETAMENVRAYLGRLEAEMFSKVPSAILSDLGIEDKDVTLITFTPKRLNCGELDIQMKLTDLSDNSLPEIRTMMKLINTFYQVKDISKRPDVFLWALVGTNLVRSNDDKTVKKVNTNDHETSNAVGSISWISGVHSWKLKLDASIDGSTTAQNIHWMVIGVAVQSPTQQLPNTYHSPAVTFGYCTYSDNKYYSLGEVSKNYKPTGPGNVLTLELDSDLGTLAFSHENESPFLIINVPKQTKMSPWVHLYTASSSNSITIL